MMTTIADQIIQSLEEEPESWKQDIYTIYHKGGIRLWVDRARSGLQIQDSPRGMIPFTFWQKRRVWKAIERWQQQPIDLKLEQTGEDQ